MRVGSFRSSDSLNHALVVSFQILLPAVAPVAPVAAAVAVAVAAAAERAIVVADVNQCHIVIHC
jgi:hypothetical protein